MSQDQPEKSYGNISDRHWSRARQGMNEEALEYYRERSKAPGVAEGGGARNHYCLACDGVIPLDSGPPTERCPHCGAELDLHVKRYFNWVEIDSPPTSDAKALLPIFAGVVVLVGGLIAWWLW